MHRPQCQCISISAYESTLRLYLLLNVCKITTSLRRALCLGLAISVLLYTLLYLYMPRPPCQCISISAYESTLRLYLLLNVCKITTSLRRALCLGLAISVLLYTLLYLYMPRPPCQCISISAYESTLRLYLLLNVCMITASMRRALNLGLAISFLINTLLYLSLPKPPCQCLSISAYESMLRLYLLLDIYLQLVRSCPTLTQRHQPQQRWWRTWRLCSSSWR